MKGRSIWEFLHHISAWVAALVICLCFVNADAVKSYRFELKWGSKGSGDGEFDRPHGIAVDSWSNVYVADTWNHRVQKFDNNGQFLASWGAHGSDKGQFDRPIDVGLDSSGNIYVLDSGNCRIQVLDSSGDYVREWGSEGSGDGEFGKSQFGSGPCGIAVDPWGDVYVADTYNHRIQVFDISGEFLTKWGSEGSGDGQFREPRGIAVAGSMNVYVAEWSNHRVQKFDSSGTFLLRWGSSGIGAGWFNSPWGVAVDRGGILWADVFVVDSYNHRVQKFGPGGDFLTKWGSKGTADGEFSIPFGIATDSSGNVFVADTNNNRVQKFKPDFVIRRISGATEAPTIEWNSVAGKWYGVSISSDLVEWIWGGSWGGSEPGWGTGFNYWTDHGQHDLGPASGQTRRFYRVSESVLGVIYNLLVLTPAEFERALIPLVAHKNANGTTAMIRTLESIYADSAYAQGRDCQEKIKLAIADMHEKNGVKYVMLVGDVDKFPVRYIRGYDSVTWGNSFAPSDLYYADLYDMPDDDPWDLDDGGFDDWDSNDNDLFGESGPQEGLASNWSELNVDQADLKPDVAVGRIPASRVNEVTKMVNKIISYEQAGAEPWRNNIMLVTGNWDGSNDVADDIAERANAVGLGTIKWYWTTRWDAWPEVDTRAEFLNGMMNQGLGFVAYLGHGAGGTTGVPGGNGGEWQGWYRYWDVAHLNNSGKLPVILAAACSTAAFHFQDWPYLDTSGNEFRCESEDDEQFRKDATFKKVPNLAVPSLIAFESYNFPGYFMRNRDSDLYIEQDTGHLFQIVGPKHSPTEYWRSFRSHNYPDRYIRHSFFGGEVMTIATDLDREDATFRIVPGLADDTIAATYHFVSLESWNFPGYYLADEEGRLVLRRRGTCDEVFDGNATFKMIAGLADGSAASFESYTKPGHFVRHWNFHLYVQENDGGLFEQDATFGSMAPQHDPTPDYCSLQFGYANLFVICREVGPEIVAKIDAVDSFADEIGATFRIVPGLAAPGDDSYVSFEALLAEEQGGVLRTRNYPQHFLRHENFRIKLHERRPANLRAMPEPAALQRSAYDLDCLAEHFLLKQGDVGAIAYIGCYTGAQRHAFNMVQRFFEEYADLVEPAAEWRVTLGSIWNGAVKKYLKEDFPDIEGNWNNWYGAAIYQHVNKMMLFGDPSLRIRGSK